MTRHREVSQAPSNGTRETRNRTVSPASASSLGAPPAVSAGYDSHGNTLTLGGQSLTFDADDRNTGLSDATGTTVSYLRDATDRIVWRAEPVNLFGAVEPSYL